MNPQLQAIMISLLVAEQQSLFILLSADGSINRMGTGSIHNPDRDMFIGIVTNNLFDQVKEVIDPEWFEHAGGYDLPNKKGVMCELTTIFKFTDGSEKGLQFKYGSESQGPPSDIGNYVRKAVEITNSWYEQQKIMVSKAKTDRKPKPRWKLW